MTSYRHVTEIREHMIEIRKCCNFWPMFLGLKLGLKMLQASKKRRISCKKCVFFLHQRLTMQLVIEVIQ